MANSNLDGKTLRKTVLKERIGSYKNPSSSSTDSITSTSSTSSLEAQMKKNSEAWYRTSDPAEKERLHQENLKIAKQLGLTYNPGTGTYSKSGTVSSTTSKTSTEKGGPNSGWSLYTSTTSNKSGSSGSGTLTSKERSDPNSVKPPITTTKTTVSVPAAKASTPTSSGVAVRSTFEPQGLKVDFDSSTGVIRVYDPKTGHSATIDKNNYKIINGKAYIAPNVAQNVKNTISSGKYTLPGYGSSLTKSPTAPGSSGTIVSGTAGKGTSTDVPKGTLEDYYKDETAQLKKYMEQQTAINQRYFEQQQQQINTFIQQMNNYMSQLSDAGLAMLRQYQEQYEQAIAQLRQYLQPSTEIPESVKVALDVLDKQLNENIRQINNILNERGVYNSSIAADRIKQAQDAIGTEKAQLLAQWLDDQHKQMFQAAMQMANMQAQYAANYANLYSQAYMQPLQQGMSLASNIYGLQSNLAQQQYQAQSALAETGLTIANQIYETFVKGKQAEKQAEQEAQQKADQLAWEQLKWAGEQALRQAQLQETQRHNIAMERKPSGSSYPSAAYIKLMQELQAAQEKTAHDKAVADFAVKYTLDPVTAKWIYDNQDYIRQNPDWALKQLQADKDAGLLKGADIDYIRRFIESARPKQTSTPKTSTPTTIINRRNIRNIGGLTGGIM
ncbi:hypothetical protein D2962_09755 [Biomaibacter acetigenes]|uniref:Uncharacterized protein n=1 Tax=Biomaibacter acetigenes TaxID=2316383 RepID=A0A3G2R5P1_9FIRM|nr:hypothetical protein [Biomaibacter acetigenes]AYO30864.1 hypothetical protein D2962_09755 [Biomaibacter acetigenes]